MKENSIESALIDLVKSIELNEMREITYRDLFLLKNKIDENVEYLKIVIDAIERKLKYRVLPVTNCNTNEELYDYYFNKIKTLIIQSGCVEIEKYSNLDIMFLIKETELTEDEKIELSEYEDVLKHVSISDFDDERFVPNKIHSHKTNGEYYGSYYYENKLYKTESIIIK